MKGKSIIWLIISFIISGIIVTVFNNNTKNNLVPVNGYRVYLEGKTIGYIKSKDELNKYINIQQEKLKKQYNVDTIYIPNDINVVKELTYEDSIDNVETIYNKINAISPFTIRGYQVIVDRTNSTQYQNDDNTTDENKAKIVKINIINKEIFTKAVESVILSFVDDDQYKAFVDKEKLVLESTGELIENIYIEDDIVIKEANLPTNETIYMDADSLARFLIFGNNTSNKKYVVKTGDSIDKIADNNSMSINELLIANSNLTSETSLLYVGQELSIGSVDPVFTTIVEKHVVADQVVKYTTQVKYDNTMYQGESKTQQKGSNGLNRVTQKIKMINGEISQAYIVSSEELVPVVNEIVIKGGKQAKRGDGAWSWPTNIPYIISSRFGWRWGKLHRGVDICGTGRGSPIYAARDGVVTNITYHSSMGYFVTIKHDNGYYTQYGHMQNTNGNDRAGGVGSATKYISIGQRVKAHDVIGEMGSSGGSTGVHLHFEIWDGPPYEATCYNPLLYY